MSIFKFEIIKKSKKSQARLGLLHTPHGTIKTPAFVTVGTKGTVKTLTPEDLDSIGTQFVFVNTYHSVLSPGVDIIAKAGGIRPFSKIKQPMISDSGGFQVFSLARTSTSLVKITEDGVEFRSPIDGEKHFFTPEFSLKAQNKIGADFVVAFDECAPNQASYEYTLKAMNRTHEWAKRSLKIHTQQMYGVIQGGMFEDLRKKSAQFIASLPFFGLAIGGVSVGETKKEMREVVSWVLEAIQDDLRPRHLLGVGDLDDVFDTVSLGVDTMDCVLPTRHARMGKLLTNFSKLNPEKIDLARFEIDILKSKFKADFSAIDKDCTCYTCQNFTRAYLHHLFKQRELLGYRLATIHNLHFIEMVFSSIREAIEKDKI